MPDSDSLTDLIGRCRAGDRDAFDQVFQRFASRLARLAEQHLSRPVAQREGAEEVVQSVFRTFFRRSTQGQLQINDGVHLWRLLVRITLFKVRAKGRYHSADKRSVDAEVPGDDVLVHLIDRDPGPAEAAALLELMTKMVQGLDPFHARVLDLLMQGYGISAIAREVGRTRQAVYRVRALLEERLRRAGFAPD